MLASTIFDLGLHHGDDTEFYLNKGFRVMALEANPAFCAAAHARFGDAIREGRLVIVQKALAAGAGDIATFHVRSDRDDWSSLDPAMAERDCVASTKIEVETTTLGRLVADHGVPYYLKSDIEGADEFVVAQLESLAVKPRFLSVEASGDSIEALARCGYGRFQLINQGYLKLFRCPDPPREGRYVAQRFDRHISGLFGEELEPAGWVGAAVTARRLALWRDLNAGKVHPLRRLVLKKYGKATRRTWLIDSGWLDIHARLDD